MTFPWIAALLAFAARAELARAQATAARASDTRVGAEQSAPAAPDAARAAPVAQDPRGGQPAPSRDATRMGSPQNGPVSSTRETMWRAPTADEWKLPCLIRWQRNFDDALAVSRESGRPVLVCVNMDGEIASEHYAGVRYRHEDTARLYEPYVCVIASVYRHTPRDYDDQGVRVECPRFGTVTCGEHIAIEPLLYDKYFDGTRVAPRHIILEAQTAKKYDVYYAFDTDTIFNTLRAGAIGLQPLPNTKSDLPIAERVTSRDVADREALERSYREGGREVRRALIESALVHREVDQVDLLRQAIFGFDPELARTARRVLAQCDTESAIDLIADALKLPMNPDERAALLDAATRLGKQFPRAQTLLAVHDGLANSSRLVDVQQWYRVASDTDARLTRARDAELAARILDRETASAARPDDATARIALAESMLASALDPATERRFAQALIEDAKRAALEAQQLGDSGWRAHVVLCAAAVDARDDDAAQRHALAAMEAGMPPPSGADGAQERAAVTVLAQFAAARQRAIAKAYREKRAWPPEWLSDIHAAYAALAKHPLGTDANVAAHYDFLSWLGATPRAAEVLDKGMARFSDSWMLHDRLRRRLLWEKGADGLEAGYAALLAKDDAPRDLEWFAGYASLLAAEHQRRASRAGAALAAYERALGHYERGVERNPDSRDTADHYAALALAGRARVELEQRDWTAATNDVLASFARKPAAAATPDGLNITPVDTAKMLRARLAEEGAHDLRARLQAGLDELDPVLLELPAYERANPTTAPASNGRRGAAAPVDGR